MLCLDTNIVIFAMNMRKPNIAERLETEIEAGTELLVPVIVLMELNYGIAKSRWPDRTRQLLEEFLGDRFKMPLFDVSDAREAAEIRANLESKGTPIGHYDHRIAAQARRRGAALVTLNRREFERVPGLIVTDWAG